MVVFRGQIVGTDEIYTTRGDRVVGYGKDQNNIITFPLTADGQDKQMRKTRETIRRVVKKPEQPRKYGW